MSFNTDLKRGDIGAALYYQAHQGTLRQTDGRNGDFIKTDTNELIELKTDYWSMASTPNFFMERYSDKAKQTLGGVWQALANGCDIFVYLYVRDLKFYQFQTKALVEALDEIIKTLPPTDIANSKYITQGYRVPRNFVQHLATQYTMVVEAKPDGK